jgi:hypothetical protein
VLIGGIATVTSYLTQLTLYNESLGRPLPGRSHMFWLRFSLLLLLLGILAFGAGALWAVAKLQ